MSHENMSADEEYQYPQDEYVVETDEMTVDQQADEEAAVVNTKATSPLKKFLLENKRKVAVAVVAVFLLLFFQFMNHGKNSKIVQPASTTEKVAKVSQKPAKTTTVSTVRQDPRLVASLASIQNSGTSNAQEIRRLKNELQVLQRQLDQSNQTNQQLKQAMVLLLQEVKKVNAELKKAAPKAVVAEPAMAKPKVTYSVHAMISGRAWLVSSNGLSRSVIVGDTIPGLGVVEQIDAERGLVLMSSGNRIGYGSNDS